MQRNLRPLEVEVLLRLLRVGTLATSPLALPIYGLAQEPAAPSGLSPVFYALEGAWEGTGSLLDRPAEFHMEWRLGPGPFAHLSFAEALVDDQGDSTPVLQSGAVYLSQSEARSPTWSLTRPRV